MSHAKSLFKTEKKTNLRLLIVTTTLFKLSPMLEQNPQIDYKVLNVLLVWRKKLAELHGKKGFDAIQNSTLQSGIDFHKEIEHRLLKGFNFHSIGESPVKLLSKMMLSSNDTPADLDDNLDEGTKDPALMPPAPAQSTCSITLARSEPWKLLSLMLEKHYTTRVREVDWDSIFVVRSLLYSN